MMTTIRAIAVGAVFAGAAVGLASPASAEPLSGSYNATMIEPGASGGEVGLAAHFLFTPCGPDCTGAQSEFGTSELHPQGDAWTGSSPGSPCTWTIDSSLVISNQCPGDPRVAFQLTKAG